MSTVESDCSRRKLDIESKVIEVIKAREEFTLNAINNYGENLLHIAAANGCTAIIKEILATKGLKNVCDRKNKFGWTALMLAIRNRNVDMVKLILANNASTNESTYLGMSVLGLAAAINKEMFECVYDAYPPALAKANSDDITPLCIAAMKNDKKLFFRLIELGCDPSKSNEYTRITMAQSTVPEIASLGRTHLEVNEYWKKDLDSIEIQLNIIGREAKQVRDNLAGNLKSPRCTAKDGSKGKDNLISGSTTVKGRAALMPVNLNVLFERASPAEHSLISPTFSCDVQNAYPTSPNMHLIKANSRNRLNQPESSTDNANSPRTKKERAGKGAKRAAEVVPRPKASVPVLNQRLQLIRPPDLNLASNQDDPNVTLSYTPEFSPLRSPCVPAEINDENVFGVNTPTPPRCQTPPRGVIFTAEKKMLILLNRYELSHLAGIFLEQEVDFDLFLTLTDTDLIEIGIERKPDRRAVLTAIADFRGTAGFPQYVLASGFWECFPNQPDDLHFYLPSQIPRSISYAVG